MNTLLHIVAIGIITTLLSVILKQHKPELALCVSVAGGVLIFLYVIPLVNDALTTAREITLNSGIDNEYLYLIIRVIVVAYVAELGAGIARDAGEGAIATKVELGGKFVIFAMCIPTIITLIEMVTSLML